MYVYSFDYFFPGLTCSRAFIYESRHRPAAFRPLSTFRFGVRLSGGLDADLLSGSKPHVFQPLAGIGPALLRALVRVRDTPRLGVVGDEREEQAMRVGELRVKQAPALGRF